MDEIFTQLRFIFKPYMRANSILNFHILTDVNHFPGVCTLCTKPKNNKNNYVNVLNWKILTPETRALV